MAGGPDQDDFSLAGARSRRGVAPTGPAAGLSIGDHIIAIDGKDVSTAEQGDIAAILAETGEQVEVVVENSAEPLYREVSQTWQPCSHLDSVI